MYFRFLIFFYYTQCLWRQRETIIIAKYLNNGNNVIYKFYQNIGVLVNEHEKLVIILISGFCQYLELVNEPLCIFWIILKSLLLITFILLSNNVILFHLGRHNYI